MVVVTAIMSLVSVASSMVEERETLVKEKMNKMSSRKDVSVAMHFAVKPRVSLLQNSVLGSGAWRKISCPIWRRLTFQLHLRLSKPKIA